MCSWTWLLVTLALTLAQITSLTNAELIALTLSDASSPFSYTLAVNGQTWLSSNATFFTSNGRVYSTSDGSLTLQGIDTGHGWDSIGTYTATRYTWSTAATVRTGQSHRHSRQTLQPTLSFQTNFRYYADVPGQFNSRASAVVFEQKWLTGGNDTVAGNIDTVLSSFPSFNIGNDSDADLGYVSYGGNFVFDNTGIGRWAEDAVLASGGQAGPLILFDEPMSTVAMLAPLTQFMDCSVEQRHAALYFGVIGTVTDVPAQWSMETMIYVETATTINIAVQHWGDAMLAKYNKLRTAIYSEFTTKYVGYNTDNGAYYYYNTEPNKDYEQTMHDLYDYHTSTVSVPYRFYWLDSWWYFKSANGGVKNWTTMPSVFPSGLPALHQYLHTPIIAHNRWWSADTDYAKQNGGQYDWLIDNKHNYSVPISLSFWVDLFRNASQWGLGIYMQDWLYSEYETVSQLNSEIGLARQWLVQMGLGAAANDVNIQYCGQASRHVLQSVEIPNVVQVRASDDYIPGNTRWHNWQIALTSLLEYSLGLAPSKDDWWSSSKQPGNTYGKVCSGCGVEPLPLLQSLLATLSTGPVTPSDGIGFLDLSVVNRSIRADGLILKPDSPALFADIVYHWRAFGDIDLYVVQTGTGNNGLPQFISVTVNNSETVTMSLMSLNREFFTKHSSRHQQWLSCQLHSIDLERKVNRVQALTVHQLLADSAPVIVQPNADGFALLLVTPMIANGTLAILGDLSKWVPMSQQRVRQIAVTDSDASLELIGVSGETVRISYLFKREQLHGECDIDTGTSVVMRIQFDDPSQYQCEGVSGVTVQQAQHT